MCSLLVRCAAVAVLLFNTLACCRHAKPTTPIQPPESYSFDQSTFTLEDRGEWVYAKVEGHCTVGNVVKGVRQIFRYTAKCKRGGILLDAWSVDVHDMGTGELMLGALSLIPFWDFSLRIAAYIKEDALPGLNTGYKYPESLSIVKIRRFDTIAESEAYLKRDD